MSITKRFVYLVASCLSLSAALNAAALTADVVVLMDESGSMSGEQSWIKNTITSLDSKLNIAGLTGNRYGSVGFGANVAGAPSYTRTFDVGGVGFPFGTAAQFQSVPYVVSGATEDGYAAIDVANGLAFNGAAARNFILVTDEDRDNTNGALTYANLLASMTGTNTLLNAIVNATFQCGDTTAALGMDSAGNGYKANGSGGYTTCSGASVVGGAGTTVADYVNLALATGGAAWDLNILRNGGNDATSFTAAFVDIKVEEITEQPPSEVPEPSTWFMLGSSLIALGGYRLRRQ